MNVSAEGHRMRMRQRLQQMEVEGVRSQDVVEYLLYYALPRRDTKQQAHALLERFGSIKGIMAADISELTQVEGIGLRTAKWLKTVGSVMDTYMALEPDDKPYMGNLASAEAYLRRFFADKKDAQMWQFCLNAGGRLIGCMKLADYACWRSSEYARMAIEQAIMMRSSCVLLCYFTGDALQHVEEDEIEAVKNYGFALSVSGIKLVDHIVLSRGGISSMVRPDYDASLEEDTDDEVMHMIRENARVTGYLEGECDAEYTAE